MTDRVAILDPLGRHGGVHYYMDGLASGLARQGVDVTLYATRLTGRTGAELYRVEPVFGELYGDAPTIVRGARYLAGLIKALVSARRRGIAVVSLHAFHYGLREIAATWLARLSGMKILLTLHDVESFGRRQPRLRRWLTLAPVSGLAIHNAFSLAELVRLEGPSRKPHAVIPHGHYVGCFGVPPDRREARTAFGLDINETLFLFFGNPRPEKGLDDLLAACASLRDIAGWRLWVAGKMKPEQLRFVRSEIDRLGLSRRVRIDARAFSDDEALDCFRAADLVVVPYRRVYESGVAIMAMSLARAVLVSDLAPLVESVADGAAGLVYSRSHPTALASALADAIGNRAELDAIGERAREYAVVARGWDAIGARTIELIRRL